MEYPDYSDPSSYGISDADISASSGPSPSNDEIMASTFGFDGGGSSELNFASILQNYAETSGGGDAYMQSMASGYQYGNGQSDVYKSVDAKAPQEDDLWGRIVNGVGAVGKFAKKNQGNPLMAMALSGVANHFKNQNARDAADKQQQVAQEKIAANSASVTGIRPVKGLIQGALKRTNGMSVFDANGRIAK